MVKAEKRFYLVREDILPEYILKTDLAKEMRPVVKLKAYRSGERLVWPAAPSISSWMAFFPSSMR